MSNIRVHDLLNDVLLPVLVAVFMLAGTVVVEAQYQDTAVVYKINGKNVRAVVSGYFKPTDLNGELGAEASFAIIRFKYNGNFFNVNVPASTFKKLDKKRKEKLVAYLIGVYDKAFGKFKELFGYIPRGYRFNTTFGRTASGVPLNKVNLTDKISNIFLNTLPYKEEADVLSGYEEGVMLHEIGHGLFSIAVGNLRYSRTRAIEEGFVDYFAGRGYGEEGPVVKLPISREQADRMRGLTQMDVDSSVWSKEVAREPSFTGRYSGVTHHLFGIEFIEAFIDSFGKENLPEFLRRLRAAEDIPPDRDFGTGQVKEILTTMGYSGRQITGFEKDLHRRLRKNIFRVMD